METEMQQLKNQVEVLTNQVKLLSDLYYKNNFSDLIVFDKRIQMNRTLLAGKDGLRVGSSSTQKLGFYGVTPIVQSGSINAPQSPGGTYSQTEAQSAVNAINSIRTALTNLGLTA